MGVSPACIAAVVDASGNRLNDGEATDLIRYMEALRKGEEARGNLDGLADRVMALAAQDAERAQIAAAIAKKHAALSAVAYARVLQHAKVLVAQGLTYRKAVLAILEGTVRGVEGGRASVAATSIAYFDRYMQGWNLMLARDPEIAKRMRDPDFGRNVVIEMRELRDGGQPGRTGDQKALALAKVYAEAAETARVDLNRYGATIGRLDGWSPQGHDAMRVIRAGRDEWVDFVLPRLDREKSFGSMNDDLVRQALRDIYDEITLGTSRNALVPDNPGKAGPANLANRLGHSRTLHFADAEAWAGYAERFGSDIHTAMLGHLNRAAKAAGQMQLLGPNPGMTLQRLRLALVEMARTDPKLSQEKRAAQISSLRGGTMMNRAIDSSWAEVSGLNAPPANVTMAQIGTTLRAWQSLSKLGGAVVASITDIPQRALAMTMQGQPMLRAWRENLSDAFSPAKMRSRELREMAAVMHAGVEGMRGQIIAAGMADDAPMGKVHKTLAFFFRIQGMTAWQDWRKAGASWGLARWMGFNADQPLDSVNATYRHILRQHGIDAAEWDVIRATAREVDRDRYVTPDRIAELPLARFAGLAKPALEALDKGLSERTARRAAADAREAQWVKGRTGKLGAAVQRGIAGLQRINKLAEGGRDRRVTELMGRMEELHGRLSDLAEFHDAIAERRAWDPATPDAAPARPESSNTSLSGQADTGGARTFAPKREQYLDAGDPATLAARAEGELRGRLDALRRTIGTINRMAGQAEKTRLSEFLTWWNERQTDLDAFTKQMAERAATRAEQDKADRAAWQPRADAALADARRELEVKLRRFFADEMRFTYIEEDATTRRLKLQGTQSGTVVGEIMRAVAQFKGFPIAFTQRTLGRAIYGQPNRTAMDRLMTGANIGSVIATMTFAGYLTMTLKDLLRGFGPRDPSERETLLAALTQGGGAGILGDFLFAEANRFGGSFASTLAGPVIGGGGESLQKLYLMAREGNVKSGQALSILLQNTPFLNLWYVRPTLDFLVLNALREHLTPGYLSRMDRTRRRDFGQERVVPRSAFEF